MATGRCILSVDAINGTGCIHDCYASIHRPAQPSSSSSSHRLFANVFIAAVCTAAAAFFLVLTYYTVLVSSRRRVDRIAAGDDLPSEADGSEADYHVWRIRTVGLDESTIISISTKPYITGGGTADCSVCLGEFHDGELVRLLPACDHAFHVSCIDTWLRAHINCPLCRARVIVPADSGGGGGSATMHPDGNALITDRRVSGDLEDDSGGEIRVETVTDSTLDCPENSILRALSNVPGNKLQLVLRSNSIDSLTRRDLLISLDRELSCLEERKEQEHYFSDEDSGNEKKGKQGSSSRGDCQQKCSLEIGGGTTSGSGRMFFLSRYGRARSSSVLPL
ncbi:hypothetical protein M5K25_023115 [Dendrobium thyrsiflorum]|uniref:RING-type E3 ubiquitin transferase n=1 Tax=Dendrobium thyrsiflorum TaxID=117978 RepID=A0ABD0U7C4_DENTH